MHIWRCTLEQNPCQNDDKIISGIDVGECCGDGGVVKEFCGEGMLLEDVVAKGVLVENVVMKVMLSYW